jgi:hypothetical protein
MTREPFFSAGTMAGVTFLFRIYIVIYYCMHQITSLTRQTVTLARNEAMIKMS